MKLFLPLAVVSLLLLGCGQKGPLYKTPTKTPNQPQTSSAKAAPTQHSE